MGGSLFPCCEKLQAADPARLPGAVPSKGRISHRRSVTTPVPEKPDHQVRADLQVKNGGFALGNFAATNPGNIEEFFDVERTKIGEGGFGSVRKGRDKRTERVYAIKTIRKKGVADVSKLQEEIGIMRLLDHPNIVRFHESFEDSRLLMLVMDLCEGGELFERIQEVGYLNERQAAGCCKEMLLAINYLHQNRIMHRDLKHENFLLSSKEEIGKSPLKLIDFGLAKRFEPGTPSKTRAGTPNYIAPEVLTGKYSEKVDVWSLGVITFVLLSGKHPFTGKTVEQVLKNVKNANFTTEGKYWKGVSDNAKTFVQAFLMKQPTVRPTAAAGLRHRWVEKMAESDAGGPISALEMEGLIAFGRMNKLKKATLTVIATQLSEKRINALRAMFMNMDVNGDGTLSVHEMKSGLEKAGVVIPENLEQLLKEADTDGSGVVDYTEFLAATIDRKTYKQEDIVWTAFKKFDLDNSGFIDVKELAQVIGDEEVTRAMHLQDKGKVEKLFKTVDKNGDGFIDFDEFWEMMKWADTADDEISMTAEEDRSSSKEGESAGVKQPVARISRKAGKDIAAALKAKRQQRLKGVLEEDGADPSEAGELLSTSFGAATLY